MNRKNIRDALVDVRQGVALGDLVAMSKQPELQALLGAPDDPQAAQARFAQLIQTTREPDRSLLEMQFNVAGEDKKYGARQRTFRNSSLTYRSEVTLRRAADEALWGLVDAIESSPPVDDPAGKVDWDYPYVQFGQSDISLIVDVHESRKHSVGFMYLPRTKSLDVAWHDPHAEDSFIAHPIRGGLFLTVFIEGHRRFMAKLDIVVETIHLGSASTPRSPSQLRLMYLSYGPECVEGEREAPPESIPLDHKLFVRYRAVETLA